jgi:hypothetical protein
MRSIVLVSLFVALIGSGCGGDDGGDDETDDMMTIDAASMVPDGVVDPEPFKVPMVHVDGTITLLTLAR